MPKGYRPSCCMSTWGHSRQFLGHHLVCAEGLKLCHLSLVTSPSAPGLFWVTWAPHGLPLNPHGPCSGQNPQCCMVILGASLPGGDVGVNPAPCARLPFLACGSRFCLQAQAARPGGRSAAPVTLTFTSLPRMPLGPP